MLLVVGACNAFAQEPTARQQALRQIFQELIDINTTDSVGDTVRAAEAMAARLKAAGLPAEDVRIISTAPRQGNVVARLRGTGARKPILLLAHLDVVEAKRGLGSDPFKLRRSTGSFVPVARSMTSRCPRSSSPT
jgi:acetylornithine deacetylase/succinyl-diaminopimelate desuccinylase-like protein